MSCFTDRGHRYGDISKACTDIFHHRIRGNPEGKYPPLFTDMEMNNCLKCVLNQWNNRVRFYDGTIKKIFSKDERASHARLQSALYWVTWVLKTYFFICSFSQRNRMSGLRTILSSKGQNKNIFFSRKLLVDRDLQTNETAMETAERHQTKILFKTHQIQTDNELPVSEM